MYTVTKLKTFTGREGPGFTCTLCRDGKPVANAIQDANGGPTDVHFLDYKADRVECIYEYDGKGFVKMYSPEEALCWEYARSFPDQEHSFGGTGGTFTLEMDPEHLVDDLVNREIGARRLNRMLKKSVIMKNGKLYSVSGGSGPYVPKAGETLLNDLPFDQALDLALKCGV